MNKYGPLLKKLISFSGMKMSTVANLLSYDLSYISKWCNKSKLPAARIAPEINQTLASVFSKEIEARGDKERFFKYFAIPAGDLEECIFALLTESYKDSEYRDDNALAEVAGSDVKVLTKIGEIHHFFHQEFIDVLCAEKEPLEILCTLDLSKLLSASHQDPFVLQNPLPDVRVKIGMRQDVFRQNDKLYFKELYAFLNMYHDVNFDIYDNSLMDTMNTIVLKGKLAVLCALDQYNRISTAVVIRDIEKVNQIYLKLVPTFRSSPLLLHHERASEFNKTGYRTDFYARENYQIFTARGFEFLLPVECWKSIIQTAQMKKDGGFEARIVEKMQITWEEIFEKSSMDFFTTKSTLLKYLEDGEIVFLDVLYQMSVPERKLHIQKVLDITKKNPNIRFFVIDDDCLPDMQQLFGASVYSNRRKIFLKKICELKEENEAQFYCVDSELMTAEIVRYIDKLKDSVYCYPFDAEALQRFVDRYGSMINRMLELNEDKN